MERESDFLTNELPIILENKIIEDGRFHTYFYRSRIREMSFNLMKDGRLVVMPHMGLGSYCKTNEHRGHLVDKHLHFIRLREDWEIGTMGCGHASYSQMDRDDLTIDWQDKLEIEQSSRQFFSISKRRAC